jgi:hypothetical protein
MSRGRRRAPIAEIRKAIVTGGARGSARRLPDAFWPRGGGWTGQNLVADGGMTRKMIYEK